MTNINQKHVGTNESNKIYNHIYGGIELRTFVDALGNPWFLASDLLKTLHISNKSGSAYRKLFDMEKSYVRRSHVGLRPGKDVVFVSESGLYKLIMRSDKPEALPFQRWVCEEVLPEIRKTGSYEAGSDAPEIIKDLANSINPLDATFVEAKEYCQLKELPEELKCTLGKIATRICIEQDKPKRWTNIDKKVVKKYKLKFRSVGQYPVTVLDEAYALYQQGVKE